MKPLKHLPKVKRYCATAIFHWAFVPVLMMVVGVLGLLILWLLG